MLERTDKPANPPHRTETACTSRSRLVLCLLLSTICLAQRGPAAVLAVEPCPPIQAAPRRVVDLFEATSRSDTRAALLARIREVRNQLPRTVRGIVQVFTGLGR